MNENKSGLASHSVARKLKISVSACRNEFRSEFRIIIYAVALFSRTCSFLHPTSRV